MCAITRILAFGLIGLTIVYFIIGFRMINLDFSFNTAYFRYGSKQSEFLVWSPQCKITALDPYAAEVMQLFARQDVESCIDIPPITSVLRDPQTGNATLVINEVAKKYFHLDKSISCYYQEIFRDQEFQLPDVKVKFSEPTLFNSTIKLPKETEFILVMCLESEQSNKILYKNVHTLVPNKNYIEKRFSKHQMILSTEKVKRPISVVMIGIDSISRLNLIRAMPKTVQYLNDNDWFELEGYNKMDDNTFPNLMAVLTGFNLTTANQVCKPKRKFGLDNCPMLWYTFRESGYATAYAEDETIMSTFNYDQVGFMKPPTDYFLRPAMLVADNFLKIRTKNGLNFCAGLQYSADFVYKYAIDFAQLYKGKPYFGLFWTNSFSHNDISDPSSMDKYMKTYLQEMEMKGIFNDSVVVFFSDHGMRYGEIRRLITGWQEERLPFIFLSIPPWFQRQNPEIVEALKINKNRLTSPYDLHLTLKHILQLSGRTPLDIKGSASCQKCQSLFKIVPLNRSCEDAGIEPHWCTCNAYQPIAKSSEIVKQAVAFVVNHINMQVRLLDNEITRPKDFKLCSNLTLNQILLAGITNSEEDFSDVIVQLEVVPGGGIFESTLRYNRKGENFVLSGSISRLNWYKKMSYCVTNHDLKKYCHCKQQ